MKSSFALVVAPWLALGAAGCAQNIGDIDRTQPHRIDVSTLNDGKPWWFLQTVIDVPPQTGFTFVGESSFPPDRIVWDVQENWLVAYRNYEYLVGSSQPYTQVAGSGSDVLGNGTPTSRSAYFGSPVAAYPVLSHFDVQREYNPQTGEQTNVISENTTDRPWYERQYVRVDWGNNAFGGFNFLSVGSGGLQGDSSLLTSPLSYYVDTEDPTNPERAEITPAYIGVVNKLSYKAQIDQTASAYYGQTIYSCLISSAASLPTVGGGLSDCGPAEVKIRLSFKKIPDNHDFVPREFNDKDEIHFGVWQQQRLQYDQQRGVVEPLLSRNQNAVMHHIWTADHWPTSHDDAGVACDVNTYDNLACIRPLNARTPKPIVYYVNPQWPDINDTRHYTMWVHESLISDDYNADMRAVVAGALRGGPNSVENYMAQAGISTPDPTAVAAIDYSKADSDYSRYAGVKGLDYLAYPPQLNPVSLDASGNITDTSDSAYRGMRPSGTWLAGNTLCNSSQIAQSRAAIAAGTTPMCKLADCKNGYCMGIDHVPYTVVPRMVVFCHNPVQPRGAVTKIMWKGMQIDKSDSTQPSSFDFSTPGDPDICDPRSDQERIANPLSPQLGDLRYSMHAYIPEPDQTAPGGVGEPAMDPVTGEIVSAHAYVYGRAVESYATYSADLLAVLNGWESYSDLIQGNIVNDYITNLENNPQVLTLQPSKISSMLTSPGAQARIANIQRRIGASYGSDGVLTSLSGGLARQDRGVQAFTLLKPLIDAFDPHDPEISRDFAPEYSAQTSATGQTAALPQSIQNQISMSALVAPPALNTFNNAYEQTRRTFIERHVLMDEEMEPTALRLAKYYKDKYSGANNPCSEVDQGYAFDGGTFPGGNDSHAVAFRTCIWEKVRSEVLGNLWRSYSDHEVGHTFGQYHNFAGSTDALNYFDPYWNLRQENGSTTVGACAPGDTTCSELTTEYGSVPGGIALAPEWLQTPKVSTLTKGLREYQYTSIMDYNSKFNSDFQGIGKYDHATHMFQYGQMVEVFDPLTLTKVPPNADQTNHAHEVDDLVLQPFNAHYTTYPWILNDGAGADKIATALPTAVQKMLHARKWVRYDDLTLGGSTDVPQGLQDGDTLARDGLSLTNLKASIMVPYRFCSDFWNEGQAHCLWFDEGADAYEQANGFIKQYKFDYFFDNFKRQSVIFHLNDSYYGYYSRLWDRNFKLQSRIMQHYINDELILRGNSPCAESKTRNPHFAALACGQDRTAAAVSIVDFGTKLLQTPATDVAGFDATKGVYCGQASCGQDSLTPDLSGSTLPALTLLPGNSSKYDISQYSLAQYGTNFNVKPTAVGIWLDKILAVFMLSYYETYFVGELNNQPLSYLISANDFFFKDTQRAIGALVTNDPRYWPLLSYNPADPNGVATPPVTLYRNSDALARVTNLGVTVNPWCPSDDPTCAAVGTPPTPKISNEYTATYDAPPAGYRIAQYVQPPTGSPLVNFPNGYAPMDPAPVYFEKLAILSLGVVYLTQAVDDQRFIDSIKISRKGDLNQTIPGPLACGGDPTAVLGTSDAPTCANGSSCGAGAACPDNSACAIRTYHCGSSDSAGSRTAGLLTGACYYGGGTSGQQFSYANCDPNAYAEYVDPHSTYVYYAVRYTPSNADLTDNSMSTAPNYYNYYSPGYELLKTANQQAQAGTTGLGAAQFIDIFRGYYNHWANGSAPQY